jgi:N-acetyl-beta-hexosaminidase
VTPAPETSSPGYLVLLVRAVSHAMKAESALTRADVPHKLIPVPRSLSAHCGVCIRVAPGDREAAEDALTAAGIEIVAIHELHQTSHNKEATHERPAAEC